MKFLTFLLAILLLACNRGKQQPADLLPPQKMTTVLKQVLTADEWVAWRAEKDPSVPVFQESIRLYRGIFKKEGITEDQFRKSVRYYQDHPQLLRPVMDTLVKHPGIEGATRTDTLLQPQATVPIPVPLHRRPRP
jgi:hypothetical protein